MDSTNNTAIGKTVESSTATKLLRLIDACDQFPYSIPGGTPTSSPSSKYYLFAVLTSWSPDCTTLQTIGYVQPFVITGMPWTSYFKLDHIRRVLTIPFTSERSESEIIASQLAIAREQKSFTILTGWRNELYQVLGIKNRLIEMERAGTPLFGIATRGAHCTAYTYSDVSSLKTSTSSLAQAQKAQGTHPDHKSPLPTLIIPFRSATKSSYPGMLDNTIAGGISSRESPWIAYLREAGEEVGLTPTIAARARPVGTISYWHLRDKNAGGEVQLVQPEIQYCYDLELDLSLEDEQMRVVDGEVGGFTYFSFAEAWAQLMAEKFKPNCGLVLMDFFIRWSYVRAGDDEIEGLNETQGGTESEVDPVLAEIKKLPSREGFDIPAQEYNEIISRLHRKLTFEDITTRL